MTAAACHIYHAYNVNCQRGAVKGVSRLFFAYRVMAGVKSQR